MSKKKIYQLYIVIFLGIISLVACQQERLPIPKIQQRSTTLLDQWLREEYLIPYNINVMYKSTSYNVQFFRNNIVPDVEQVRPTLHAIKKLIIEPLDNIVDSNFCKNNGPRFIQLFGAPNFNGLNVEDIATPLGGSIAPLFDINHFDEGNKEEVYRLCRFYTFAIAKAMMEKKPVDLDKFAKFNVLAYEDWTKDAKSQKGRYDEKTPIMVEFGYFTKAATGSALNDFCETFSILVCKSPKIIDGYLNSNEKRMATGKEILRKKVAFVDEYLYKNYGIVRKEKISRLIPRAIEKYAAERSAVREGIEKEKTNK